MTSQINTHDREALIAEFSRVPKPKNAHELVGVALESIQDTAKVEIHGVKVGLKLKPLTRWWNRRKDAQAIAVAAWRWLRPDDPPTFHQLRSLQRRVGLEHLEHAEFCSRLVDQCHEFAREHPRLARFISAQIAEAEFAYSADTTPSLEEDARSVAQFQSHLLVAMAARDPRVARELARDAMEAVATIVHRVLRPQQRPSQGAYDANLMTRFPTNTPLGVVSPGTSQAADLWDEVTANSHGYFVVVAETPPERYRGFWVPDIRPGGTPLPGAPKAVHYGKPQVVALCNLPPFPIQDLRAEGRWRAYLSGSVPGDFQGNMFFSLPVFGETRRGGGNAAAVVGVINVNVRDEQEWPRSYSSAWLERAAHLATPWAITAWHAYILAYSLENAAPGPTLGSLPAFARLLLEEAITYSSQPPSGIDPNE